MAIDVLAWLRSAHVVRRALIVGVGCVVAGAAAWAAEPLAQRFGRQEITSNRALWMALTAEVVFAAYKWGVGSWSRYVPPVEAHMTTGTTEPATIPRTPAATTTTTTTAPATS